MGIFAAAMTVRAAAQSPELLIDAHAPIVHQRYFRGERELFGYNPWFSPNTVTFDPQNAPYIAVGVAGGVDVVHPSDAATDGVVQTLDASGQWIRLSYVDAIRAKYPNWNGLFSSGLEKVVFDDAGDAYLLSNHTRSSNIGAQLLLYSRDKARTWQVYQLPSFGVGTKAHIEAPDNQHQLAGPPTITLTGYGENHTTLVLPTKNASGGLSLASKTILPNSTLPQYRVSQAQGDSNVSLTIGNLTHTVVLSMNALPGSAGTPQYAVTYDRTTGTTTTPWLLGVNGTGAPDVHNKPAIAADSQGYLHVLLGGHHDQFLYTRSLAPNSTTAGWTEPIAIGKPKHPTTGGGYTYVSMAFDQDDTLHVVGRYAGDGYRFGLDYLRMTSPGVWEDRGHLVTPFRQFYSTWNQSLTVDQLGRLFLRYSYYGDQFDYEGGPEVAAYRAKWPEDNISLISGSRPNNGNWTGQKHHDPAILMSDDGGDTWRLATTADFLEGLLTPNPFAADFNRDGAVDGLDLALWKQSFGGVSTIADADGDGDADGNDFLIWQQQLGLSTTPSGASVPEPAVVTLAIGMLALAVHDRQSRTRASHGGASRLR